MKQISTNLPDDLYEKYRQWAERENMTVYSLLKDILEKLSGTSTTCPFCGIDSGTSTSTTPKTEVVPVPVVPQSDSVITPTSTTGSTVDPLPIVDFPQEKAPVITKRYQRHSIRVPVITEEKPTHCDRHPDIELTEEDGNLLCYKCLNG